VDPATVPEVCKYDIKPNHFIVMVSLPRSFFMNIKLFHISRVLNLSEGGSATGGMDRWLADPSVGRGDPSAELSIE
jgi:hypothetical protein